MDNITLKLPDYDLELKPGDEIRIGRFDHHTWVVKYGWYSWSENRPVCGWYVVDMVSQTLKPLQYTDLEDIYVVESGPAPEPPAPVVLIEKNITENGIYNAEDDDADGYSTVDVEVLPTLIEKEITENGTYIAAEDDAEGYSKVVIDVEADVLDFRLANFAIPQAFDQEGNVTMMAMRRSANGVYHFNDGGIVSWADKLLFLDPASKIYVGSDVDVTQEVLFTPAADFGDENNGIWWDGGHNEKVMPSGDEITPGDNRIYYLVQEPSAPGSTYPVVSITKCSNPDVWFHIKGSPNYSGGWYIRL